jgi:CTP:phosphocholine cytidylyltransferase-like protein
VLQGTCDIIKPWADAKALDVLKSGSVTLQTRVFNHANVTVEIVNGAIMDTWSYATDRKQVQLTQNGDSYIYNAILGENQIFLTDQYGVEVFIETRR